MHYKRTKVLPTAGWCLVAWSDFLLFAIFENGHITANQVYFYELNYLFAARARGART